MDSMEMIESIVETSRKEIEEAGHPALLAAFEGISQILLAILEELKEANADRQ